MAGREWAKPNWCWPLVVAALIKRRVMGRVIPFHIPDGFKPRMKVKEVAQREAGKVIEFRPAEAKRPA